MRDDDVDLVGFPAPPPRVYSVTPSYWSRYRDRANRQRQQAYKALRLQGHVPEEARKFSQQKGIRSR